MKYLSPGLALDIWEPSILVGGPSSPGSILLECGRWQMGTKTSPPSALSLLTASPWSPRLRGSWFSRDPTQPPPRKLSPPAAPSPGRCRPSAQRCLCPGPAPGLGVYCWGGPNTVSWGGDLAGVIHSYFLQADEDDPWLVWDSFRAC